MGGEMISLVWDKEPITNLAIPLNENSLCYTWKGKVFFTISQFGDTIVAHMGAKFRDRKHLVQAIKQFAQYLGFTYPSVNKIAVHSLKKGSSRVCIKAGFKYMFTHNNCEVLWYGLR